MQTITAYIAPALLCGSTQAASLPGCQLRRTVHRDLFDFWLYFTSGIWEKQVLKASLLQCKHSAVSTLPRVPVWNWDIFLPVDDRKGISQHNGTLESWKKNQDC